MRLRFLPTDLESKRAVSRFSKKQLDEIRPAVTGKRPMAIKPQLCGSRTVGIIVPTELSTTDDNKWSLKLKPVYARCFQVRNARTDEVRMIVAEFDFGQFSFDSEGAKPSTFTTRGAGVGDIRSAETLLSDLMAKEPNSGPILQVTAFIQKNLAKF